MRAIWKGAVSFGLVSVPVKLYSATESHDISFRQVHAKDGGRIKYQRVCSIDGEEVAYADIAKGYETEDGQMVILDDDDFAELPANSSREISVEKFVPSDQIDPIMARQVLLPRAREGGRKPYALLRDALKESDRVAVVTVSIRTRMTTAVLRVRDDVHRDADDAVARRGPQARLRRSTRRRARRKPQELEMAKLLLETLAGDYDADEFEDDYAEAVAGARAGQARGRRGQGAPRSRRSPTGEVVDLLAALQQSVAAAKTVRGEASSDDEGTTDEEAAKKPAAKKAAQEGRSKKPAKKTTAKKTTKKTAAKKAS